MARLLLWGAGGHGKVVLDVARTTGRFGRFAFLDGNRARAGSRFGGYEVLGEALEDLAGTDFIVSVGDNSARARCYEWGLAVGLKPVTLIHSNATVSPSAIIGTGTVVMAGAVINADARIGENCIINTGAIVEHDCIVSDHVHISPGAALGGSAIVERYAHIGIGAAVLPGATVGEAAIVGAGAVVLKHAPAGTTVVGVPARSLLRSALHR